MIVPVNSEKYRNLFADAERFLELSEGTINDLNAYYGYMKDFYNKAAEERKGYRYIMMPMDEEVFGIDLNTRTISIPTTFSKIGGVQADQMAELVIFETDRYFDYMDLANTFIYVQWQLPNANHTTGATYIDMKDLESNPGKIRFAWPLHDVITQYDGIVKFSVRFYLIEKEKDENGSFYDKLAYALNTLEASFVIKPALNPTANVLPERLGGLFEKSIINSLYAGEGRIPPKQPSFDEPGLNMTIVDRENSFVRYANDGTNVTKIQVAKLHNNKLSLKVQAYTEDAGNIQYKWKLSRDGNVFDDGSLKWDYLNTPGEFVYEKAVFPINPATGKQFLSNLDRYYQNIGTEEEPEWQPFTGSEIPENIQLFEKYSQYNLPEEGDVVGYYAVEAVNIIGDLETNGLASKDTQSSLCYLPGPADIKFEDKIFSDVIEDGLRVIKVNIAEDINSPNITNTWYYSSLEKDDVITSADKNGEALSAVKITNFNNLKPGWYAAHVNANLNRKNKTAGTPEAHTVYATAKIDEVKPERADTSYTLAVGDIQPLKIIVTVNPPEGFTKDTISEKIYKNLKYRWEYSVENKNEWIEIKPEDVSETNPTKFVVSMNGDTLTVRKPQNETVSIRRYRCVVTNDLGDKNFATVTPVANEEVFFII